jgi:hypothetical protein
MATEDEKKFLQLIDVVNAWDGWSVERQDGHRQSFWIIRNPTGEMQRFPIPITINSGHPKSFKLRAQQIGFPWPDAIKHHKGLLKQQAEAQAAETRAAEARMQEALRAKQDSRAAELLTAAEARKPRWVRPRRYTVTMRVTPDWALPYVTDNLGPSGRDPLPACDPLVKAYTDAITAGQLTDSASPVILDWNGRLLVGHELLLAVIEANTGIDADVTHDVDPDMYELLNLPLTCLSGDAAAPLATTHLPPDATDDSTETEGDEADDEPAPEEDPGLAERRAENKRARRNAALRILHGYDNIPVSAWAEDRLSAAELDQIAEDYPGLEAALAVGQRMTQTANKGRPCVSPAPAHAFAYLAMREWPGCRQTLDEFIEGGLKGYGLVKGDPRAALHDYLYRASRPAPGAKKRTNVAEQLMVLITCWNAYCTGRSMRLTEATWAPDGDTVLIYAPADED